MAAGEQDVVMEESTPSKDQGGQKMFTLKKWNAVAMWSWDVECDTCAICRVQVMGEQCKKSLKFFRLLKFKI